MIFLTVEASLGDVIYVDFRKRKEVYLPLPFVFAALAASFALALFFAGSFKHTSDSIVRDR